MGLNKRKVKEFVFTDGNGKRYNVKTKGNVTIKNGKGDELVVWNDDTDKLVETRHLDYDLEDSDWLNVQYNIGQDFPVIVEIKKLD